MPIYPGNSGFIADVAAGASGIGEIYAGSNLVWQKTPDYGKWDWADGFNGAAVSSRWWTNAESLQITNGVVNTPGMANVTTWTTQRVFAGYDLDAEVTIGTASVGGEYTSFMVGSPQNHFEVTLGSPGARSIWEIRNGQMGVYLASIGAHNFGPGAVVGFTRRGDLITVWLNHNPIGSARTNAGIGQGQIGFAFRSKFGLPIPKSPGIDHVGIMAM